MLSIAGWFGKDPLAAAPWIQGIFLAATTALTALAAWRLTRSAAAAATASLLAAATVLETVSYALSEGLFTALLLAALLLLAGHLDRPRWWMLAGAGAAAGLALLTRFAGASILIAAAGVLLFYNAGPGRSLMRKIIDTGVFLALALIPTLLWSWHLGSVETATARSIAFHPPGGDAIKLGLATLGSMTGKNKSAWMGLAAVVAALGYLVWRFWPRSRRRRPAGGALMVVMLVFALLYVPFLIISMTLMDAATALNSRILCPLAAPLAVVAMGLTWEWIQRGAIARLIIAIILAALGSTKLYKSISWCVQTHHKGLGYSSLAWRDSSVLQWAARLPQDQRIYTNGKDVFYFLQDRLTESLPATANRKRKVIKNSENIKTPMETLARKLAENHGLLIYFDGIDRGDFLADAATIKKYMPLQLVKELPDGKVYRLDQRRPATQAATQGAAGL